LLTASSRLQQDETYGQHDGLKAGHIQHVGQRIALSLREPPLFLSPEGGEAEDVDQKEEERIRNQEVEEEKTEMREGEMKEGETGLERKRMERKEEEMQEEEKEIVPAFESMIQEEEKVTGRESEERGTREEEVEAKREDKAARATERRRACDRGKRKFGDTRVEEEWLMTKSIEKLRRLDQREEDWEDSKDKPREGMLTRGIKRRSSFGATGGGPSEGRKTPEKMRASKRDQCFVGGEKVENASMMARNGNNHREEDDGGEESGGRNKRLWLRTTSERGDRDKKVKREKDHSQEEGRETAPSIDKTALGRMDEEVHHVTPGKGGGVKENQGRAAALWALTIEVHAWEQWEGACLKAPTPLGSPLMGW